MPESLLITMTCQHDWSVEMCLFYSSTHWPSSVCCPPDLHVWPQSCYELSFATVLSAFCHPRWPQSCLLVNLWAHSTLALNAFVDLTQKPESIRQIQSRQQAWMRWLWGRMSEWVMIFSSRFFRKPANCGWERGREREREGPPLSPNPLGSCL